REQRGQTLYPLDWVSHAIDQAATVWAELQGFPQRQVFGVARPTADLVGFAGAATFDFTDPPLRRRAAPTAPLAAAG
ncbi:MAG TPA: hypothetical protein PKC18_07415, partial [Lacipirellulaceae bacterium]|nr:hypothetical protein [Lacipirellulaceae bacterium]